MESFEKANCLKVLIIHFFFLFAMVRIQGKSQAGELDYVNNHRKTETKYFGCWC